MILLDASTQQKGKKVDITRLRSLIVPGILDGNRPPSEKDIFSITIKIQLVPCEHAKAFVRKYYDMTAPITRGKTIRLR